MGRNNIEKLVSVNNKKISFIFVGKTHEKRILEIIKLLERKNKVIYDDKTKTKFYELNFSKAILFDINGAKIQNYIIYHGLNIHKIKKDIQTKGKL